jgi:adenine-specific DNA-methyltransferase
MAEDKKKMPVSSIKHREKRANIPTEELRDFYADDLADTEKALYPRDASLDPQLVWRGKDQLDAEDLAVPVVPIYIQEKISPQALVEDLMAKTAASSGEATLFDDFNGGPSDFESKIEFYQHEQNWTNRLVLGDSLLIMNSLIEKEGMRGKVQTIYIDPPYGIKFGSNWQVSTKKRDVKDTRSEDATRQPEQIRAFRDTWKLGIHSYLTYLRDRLSLSREILTESGSIFVQIGEENVHLVRNILDEVFGSENYMSTISFRTTSGLGASFLKRTNDFIIWYAKNRESVKFRKIFVEKSFGEDTMFSYVESEAGVRRSMTPEEKSGSVAKGYKPFRYSDLVSSGLTPSCVFPIDFDSRTFEPGRSRSWKTNSQGMENLKLANRLAAPGNTLQYVTFHNDFPVSEITNVWTDTVGELNKSYVVQTSNRVIERCMLMTTDPGDIVLDPTCGSGTTAVVAEQWGRRWITCDTSRVALALTRTRLMSSKFPYFLLSDSQDGVRKEEELSGTHIERGETHGDIRKGFVYKRVPHVTLKAIATNQHLKPGMSQPEIEAAIAKGAEFELLFDSPYELPNRVRVSGPFSVESLSPHRVLDARDTDMSGSVSESEVKEQQDFASMILDNLRRSGVQNTKKDERLNFVSLEPFAGTWINAIGTFADNAGQTKRVAVSLGPEHGTVGPTQVKQAAKEAVQGVGYDILLVCGFAFDPHVSEESKRYGTLTVLPTKMNPDLTMGEELLKQTGAGNLFMVFGEPDTTIEILPDGKVSVELLGVDIYDPTTGQIRSSSTDEIACWFIDTNYNEESFFVRQAYFSGADRPMEKLQKALRSRIDEEAWSYFYGTKSRPFDAPSSGKVAIKVINHYGDEVLRVVEL